MTSSSLNKPTQAASDPLWDQLWKLLLKPRPIDHHNRVRIPGEQQPKAELSDLCEEGREIDSQITA